MTTFQSDWLTKQAVCGPLFDVDRNVTCDCIYTLYILSAFYTNVFDNQLFLVSNLVMSRYD